MEELSKHPDVDRLVGHSLGSSVVQEINNRHGNKYATTVYSSPFVSGTNQQKIPPHLRFKNKNDPIAMFDDAAITADIGSVNVLENHGYQNWEGNGLTSINPTTNIDTGFNPNSTPEQQNLNNISNNMYRNKDKQNTIPLEKKLTKEATKYDKQYKNLDYDTIKDMVDTKKLINKYFKKYNFK